MRISLILSVFLVLPCAACFGDAPDIDGTAGTGGTGTTGTAGTASTTGSSSTSGNGATVTSLDGGSSGTDTGMPPMCGEGGVAVPPRPDGWSAPFFAYGLSSNLAMPPECGGGTRGVPLGTEKPGATSCNCVCDAPPEQVCSVLVENCVSTPIAAIGTCLDLEGVPEGIGFFPMDVSACEATLRVVPNGEANLAFRCEVVVENGCTSDAPEAEGLCVVADGEFAECPPGYDAGPPVMLEDPRCGACTFCDSTAYCSGTAMMEHFDALGCEGAPFLTTTAGQCTNVPSVSVRMAPIPAICDPIEAADPTPISLCCAP